MDIKNRIENLLARDDSVPHAYYSQGRTTFMEEANYRVAKGGLHADAFVDLDRPDESEADLPFSYRPASNKR